METQQGGALIVMGTLLTRTCAAFGLTCLVATSSGAGHGDATPLVLKTVSVRVKNRTISDVETLLWSLTSPNGTVVRLKSKRELRITDVPSEVDRMVQIARAVDKSSVPDQSIWIFTHMTSRSSETASSLNELFMKERPPGVTLSKVIPVDSKRVLVVVGNRAAGHWILQRRPKGCTGPPLGPDFEPVELPIGPPPGAH